MWDLGREDRVWEGGLQDKETAWAILDTVFSRNGVFTLVAASMSGPEHQAVVLGVQSLLAEEVNLVPLAIFTWMRGAEGLRWATGALLLK